MATSKSFSANSKEGLNMLTRSFSFIKKHFLVLFTLGMVAASGRVFQLGGFGEISKSTDIVLEVLIQGSRITLFLFVLGNANLQRGFSQLIKFFTEKNNRNRQLSNSWNNIKKFWPALLAGFIGFSVLTFFMNYMIDLTAFQTCMLLHLKNDGLLASGSSEWTILLFFKNLSVIPFTLVFETLMFVWLSEMKTFRTIN